LAGRASDKRSEETPSRGAKKSRGRAVRQEASTPAGEEGISFEDAFSIAESAVDGLERGELSLEESLRTYEKGLRALGRCYEVLQHLDRRIEVLGSELGSVVEDDEGVTWRPAETSTRLRATLNALERTAELPPLEEKDDENRVEE
jgi:exodeoxyribonuclease VII small subunit